MFSLELWAIKHPVSGNIRRGVDFYDIVKVNAIVQTKYPLNLASLPYYAVTGNMFAGIGWIFSQKNCISGLL